LNDISEIQDEEGLLKNNNLGGNFSPEEEDDDLNHL